MQLVVNPFQWSKLLGNVTKVPDVFGEFTPDTIQPAAAAAAPRAAVQITVQAGITVLDEVREVVQTILGQRVRTDGLPNCNDRVQAASSAVSA